MTGGGSHTALALSSLLGKGAFVNTKMFFPLVPCPLPTVLPLSELWIAPAAIRAGPSPGVLQVASPASCTVLPFDWSIWEGMHLSMLPLVVLLGEAGSDLLPGVHLSSCILIAALVHSLPHKQWRAKSCLFPQHSYQVRSSTPCNTRQLAPAFPKPVTA